MDSLTERIKKNCLKGGVWTWDLIDQEIVAWKKKQSDFLLHKLAERKYIIDVRILSEAFELEISEPEKVKDLGMCGKPVGIKDYEFGEYTCAKDKPCPIHDKADKKEFPYPKCSNLYEPTNPKKKPSQIIEELSNDFPWAGNPYLQKVMGIIKYLDEQAESKG